MLIILLDHQQKQMQEGSNNLIVEENRIENKETINQDKMPALISYEEGYTYLQNKYEDNDHMLISKIIIKPSNAEYKITFYEISQSNIREESHSDNHQINMNNTKIKIATLNIESGNTDDLSIRLPITKESIQIQVRTQSNEILASFLNHFQYLDQNTQHEIVLYHHQGHQGGSVIYSTTLVQKKINCNIHQNVEKENLLQSIHQAKDTNMSHIVDKNFTQNHSVLEEHHIKKQQSVNPNHSQYSKQNQSQTQKLNLSTGTIVTHQIHPSLPLRRRKNYRFLEEEQNQSRVQYRQQQQQVQITVRVKLFKTPIQIKDPQVKYEVDFDQLKKRQGELGLSNINFQGMFNPRYKKWNQAFVQCQPLLPPIHHFQSDYPQIEDKTLEPITHERRYNDCGIGTYTPLSSRTNSIEPSSRGGIRCRSVKPRSIRYSKDMSRKDIETPKKSLRRYARTEEKQEINVARETIEQPSSHVQLNMVRNLNLSNKIVDIKVIETKKKMEGELPIPLINIDRQKRQKKWESCRESAIGPPSNPQTIIQSNYQPEYDLIVNSISLNFRKKTHGSKYIELGLAYTSYLTEPLTGNNLIWIGKNYHFPHTSLNDQITISVNGQNGDENVGYGKIRLIFSDLFNQKQCYYQSFLLNEKEVVGILILGYQISRKRQSRRHLIPINKSNKTHSCTEIKKSKSGKKGERSINRNSREEIRHLDNSHKLPSPRTNPIRTKNMQEARTQKQDGHIGSRWIHQNSIPGRAIMKSNLNSVAMLLRKSDISFLFSQEIIPNLIRDIESDNEGWIHSSILKNKNKLNKNNKRATSSTYNQATISSQLPMEFPMGQLPLSSLTFKPKHSIHEVTTSIP